MLLLFCSIAICSLTMLLSLRSLFIWRPKEKSELVEQKVERKIVICDRAKKASVARISPSAKLLITEYGLDLSSLKASGSHGALLNPPVLAAIYHHIFVLIMLFVWLILTNLLTGLYCDCG